MLENPDSQQYHFHIELIKSVKLSCIVSAAEKKTWIGSNKIMLLGTSYTHTPKVTILNQ